MSKKWCWSNVIVGGTVCKKQKKDNQNRWKKINENEERKGE